jgi:hypothetical protein
MSAATEYTTGSLARLLGARLWQVRRVFERGLLPEPKRLGSYRVIPAADVPLVREKLVEAGYMPRSPARG